MNPADKRLAIRTEDHPIEYAAFEGVIPDGQYGAGTVMVWDRGRYDPKDDVSPEAQLGRGKIDISLQGTKLRGGFTVVRTGKPAAGKELWLLVKNRDAYADPSWDIDSPRLARSALTGRTMQEIANDGQTSMPRRSRPSS